MKGHNCYSSPHFSLLYTLSLTHSLPALLFCLFTVADATTIVFS